MSRIAAGGFQHETNSFAADLTDLEAFERADSWPALTEGAALWDVMAGLNIPLAGVLDVARSRADLEVVPLLWATAEPAGPVTARAFDAVATRLSARLVEAGPVDALYLDLRGAMICEDHPNGEAALLARLRAVVGPDLPVVVSLDLHANVSPELVRLASRIAIFRTYPHLDMAETGARCLALACDLIGQAPPPVALRHGTYLVPMAAQGTDDAPAGALYAAARETGCELAMGFPAGDTPWAGPAILAYGADADALADALAARLTEAEPGFAALRPMRAAEAVRAAMAEGAGPVVIADVADNPGGGGTADTMGLLRALIEGGARGAVLALVHAPEVAARAHAARVGATLDAALGARAPWPGDAPFEGRFAVEALSHGPVAYLGEMYGGGHAQIGPSTLLRVCHPGTDVRVIVTSIPNQALDRGFLMHFGLDPAALRIVALKSTVHFRADFAPVAARVVAAEAPGRLPSDLTTLAYRHLRAGLRRMPRALARAT